MLESMTGFGRAEAKISGRKIVLEVKSVNSKFMDVRSHLPKHYADYESKILGFVKRNFTRGNVDLFLNEEESSKKENFIDFGMAKKFYRQAKKLKKELKAAGEIDINTILKNKDVFNHSRVSHEPLPFKSLEKVLKLALSKLKAMRKREGEHLTRDIKGRLQKIDMLLKKVIKSKSELTAGIAQRLQKKVEDISQDMKFDVGRLEQEVVLYAVKGDISEEVTRLDAHLSRMNGFLKKSGPCGRKLDFMVQEINREVNTIGSKAQSSEISGFIVDMKGEIEKIREQVQNIE